MSIFRYHPTFTAYYRSGHNTNLHTQVELDVHTLHRQVHRIQCTYHSSIPTMSSTHPTVRTSGSTVEREIFARFIFRVLRNLTEFVKFILRICYNITIQTHNISTRIAELIPQKMFVRARNHKILCREFFHYTVYIMH